LSEERNEAIAVSIFHSVLPQAFFLLVRGGTLALQMQNRDAAFLPIILLIIKGGKNESIPVLAIAFIRDRERRAFLAMTEIGD